MNIRKSDLLQLQAIFEKLSIEKHPLKFSYFLAKNKSIIKKEVEILRELQKPSEEYNIFDKKRIMLAHELAERIPGTDKPVIQNNAYVMGKNQEEFDRRLSILKNEFKDAIKKFEDQISDFKEILKEEFNFDNSYKIKINDLPDHIEPQLIELFLNTGLLKEE
jgi:hypothetical protein